MQPLVAESSTKSGFMRFGQFRLRTLLLAAVPFACLMWCCTCLYQTDWAYYKYASFNCGNGRRIVISGPTFSEIVEPLYYEVVVDGMVVVPRTGFFDASIGSKTHFSLVKAEGGTLVAIFDRDTPYEIDIVHDFRTGESWPYDRTGQADRIEELERGAALRKRIEAEHPELARVRKLRDRKYLKSTDSLYLSDAGVTDDDLRNLDNIHTITVLCLERNNLTDEGLIHLRGLNGLTFLDLTGNDITGAGCKHLEALPLERLVLDETNVDDGGLQSIGRLEALRDLDLSGTQITDSGLQMICDLKALRHLDLSGTQITDGGLQTIGRLEALRRLNLSGTQMTDKGLLDLRGLKNLELLNVQGTKVSAAGVAGLTNALPNTRIVH
jgi:hypothetical protein